MKYLGIDYGTKRVGVALSDDAGEFAFPKTIFDRHMAIQEIAALASQEGIGGVVIGHSIAANETENDLAVKVEDFAKKLGAIVEVPIVFEREDFSSFEAHRYQTSAGSRDDSAAAIILQRYLDKQRKM